MIRSLTIAGCIACAGLLGCGSDGSTGEDGEQGPAGPEGPTGPTADAPHLASAAPGWGSAFSQVTLTGENFSATAEDNLVTFDGFAATVVSASETELVVEPGIATDTPEVVSINVEVGEQVSNSLLFELVPSGHARVLHELPTLFTSVEAVAGTVYFAAGAGLLATGGLYAMDDSGVVRKVIAATPAMAGTDSYFDGPLALTRDGGSLYYTTVRGATYRYDVETDSSVQVAAPASIPASDAEIAQAIDLVVDGSDIFVLHADADLIYVYSGDTTDTIAVNAAASGLAGDSANLYYSDTSTNTIHRIADPTGAQTLTADFVTGLTTPTGLAVVGADLIMVDSAGIQSAPVATGGAVAVVAADTSLSDVTSSSGDLFATRPSVLAQLVTVADGDSETTVVYGGALLLNLAIEPSPSGFYVSQYGGPGISHLAEIRLDGTSRLIHAGLEYVLDLAVAEDGSIIAPGFTDQTIWSIDVATGEATAIADSTDGLSTPSAVHVTSNGTIFFLDTDGDRVGRISATGTVTTGFGDLTGLGLSYLSLVGTDSTLYAASLTQGDPLSGVVVAISTSTGSPSLLVPPGAAGNVTALGFANGELMMGRSGGEVLQIDTATGELIPRGAVPADTCDQILGETLPLSIGGTPSGAIMVNSAYCGVAVGLAP